MCVNCQAPNQHFSDGSQPKNRDLPSSVDQGTSPDWGGRTLSSGSQGQGISDSTVGVSGGYERVITEKSG